MHLTSLIVAFSSALVFLTRSVVTTTSPLLRDLIGSSRSKSIPSSIINLRRQSVKWRSNVIRNLYRLPKNAHKEHLYRFIIDETAIMLAKALKIKENMAAAKEELISLEKTNETSLEAGLDVLDNLKVTISKSASKGNVDPALMNAYQEELDGLLAKYDL